MAIKNSIQKTKSTSPAKFASVDLLTELRLLIEAARIRTAQTVNAELVLLYWRIGKRIDDDILQNERAEYGKEIVSTLSGQLGWSHFKEIIYLENDLQRDFYAELCRVERWSVRTLRDKIGGMLFERTAIAKKPDESIRKELNAIRETDKLAPDLIFRDPYILDFLKLPADYSERELESAITGEIERFLLELGTDFSFVARQKRMSIGKEDYYLDLLFYHRGLRRLIAIELTLGKFTPEYYGKITLYLRWLDKHERRAGEESPIGLVLCAEADSEQIELLEIDKEGIRVAEYLTELPPREALQAKLHRAVTLAKQKR
jgi:predicted nuclease of restriction endonuclease-like (RecB) superfamily